MKQYSEQYSRYGGETNGKRSFLPSQNLSQDVLFLYRVKTIQNELGAQVLTDFEEALSPRGIKVSRLSRDYFLWLNRNRNSRKEHWKLLICEVYCLMWAENAGNFRTRNESRIREACFKRCVSDKPNE